MDASALHALCDGWPGVSAECKWGDDLAFMVDAKMFCVLGVGDKEQGKLAFKVEDERFLELTDRPGFRPAPYLARAKWVAVDAPHAQDAAELSALVRRAYELVRARLTRKRQRELAD